MTKKEWQTLKMRYCEHSSSDVKLEAEVVYPADQLPDLAPRVFAHRCSMGTWCAANGQGVCVWSGANPDFDPFQQDLA